MLTAQRFPDEAPHRFDSGSPLAFPVSVAALIFMLWLIMSNL